MSSLLKELTESAGDIRFEEGQEVELKGLAGVNRDAEVMALIDGMVAQG